MTEILLNQASYRKVEKELTLTESLKETIERAVPYFENVIKKDMLAGKRVLVTAHGNSIRLLVKYFENLSSEEISGSNIPTGVPLIYEFDQDFKVIKKYYLADQEELEAKMASVTQSR